MSDVAAAVLSLADAVREAAAAISIGAEPDWGNDDPRWDRWYRAKYAARAALGLPIVSESDPEMIARRAVCARLGIDHAGLDYRGCNEAISAYFERRRGSNG